MTPPERRHLFDNPRNVTLVLLLLVIICLGLLAADLFIHRHLSVPDAQGHEGGGFPAEGWFGYYCFYGFVACVCLVLAAKELRKLLMRPEDYHER